MKNHKNYLKDLQKSRKTPLLLELTKDDLKGFSENDNDTEGFNIALKSAIEIYDYELKSKDKNNSSTNVVFIDRDFIYDEKNSTGKCILLEQIVKQLEDSIKKQYNLNIVKEGTKSAISYGASGVISNLFGEYIDKGIDFIADVVSSDLTYELIEYAVDDLDVADKFIEEVEERVSESLSDTATNTAEDLSRTKLYLSKEAKSFIAETAQEFGSNMAPSELYQLILKVILNVAIGSPIVIFIKNPHKLDNDSLALISLILSIGKDVKNKSNNIEISLEEESKVYHTGISVVYAYEDETFQPYQACEEQYKPKQTLLDEQRLFSQRYAMLERPSSDIPIVAVKSHMFVGRKNELNTLEKNYYELKEKMQYQFSENDTLLPTKYTSFQVIQADPGIGKTKLVNKHLEQLVHTQQNGHQMIHLTLLNQVGHNSMNTGLGGFSKSIIHEAQRLKSVDSLLNKSIDKATSYAKDKIYDTVLDILDNNLGATAKSIYDRSKIDNKLEMFQESNMESNQKISKEEEFEKLNSAIKTLVDAYDSSIPIVLFIDDLQWIDDKSSEYITQHLMKKFNIYIIATLRNSDATTILRKAINNQALNEFTIALLEEAGISIDNKNHSRHIIETFQTNIIELKGLNETSLSELISFVIKGSKEQHYLLATTIIDKLTESNKEYVNTLFAVETINMLCDEKFYYNVKDSQEDNETLSKKLILSTTPLKFNDEIKDDNEFKTLLQKAFEILDKRYENSLSHYNDSIKDDNLHTFNLMAYAVLEERLNILQSYFAEHGNAAVNTLLFSSLLGAPFNSTIVQKVLEELSTTKEKLLKPLKEYINEGNQEISLKAEQYEIIEEVYEILSRYTSFTNAYEYKHSLLNIFLEKQLEYVLNNKVFTNLEEKVVIDSKDALYILMIQTIKEEEKLQDFYAKHEHTLNSKMYDNLLFFKQIIMNIYKKGYESNPTVWAEMYTIGLMNLANSYFNNNQISEAIPSAKEALIIRKKLYKKDSNVWAEDYSASLNNLASLYYKNSQISEAIVLQEEALSILKELYKKDSNAWDVSYTITLNNLALSYKKNNQITEAISLEKEALSIRKELYETNSDVWVEAYTTSLNNLASSYFNNNQITEAIFLQEEALIISKKLYETDSNVWVETYTTSLNNLASSYSSNNQISEAIVLQEEALSILKELYETDSNVWVEAYTTNLNNLANLYEDNSQITEAISLQEEALIIIKELYETNSDVWAEDYTISVRYLSMLYSNNNQISEAIVLQEEAVSILKELYETDSNVWAEDYSASLNNLANLYEDNSQIMEAIFLQEEALSIRKKLYETNSDVWAEAYTTSLNNLAYLYSNNNQISAAISLEKEALSIRKELYETNSDVWVEAYTISLNNLASSYSSNNQISEAIVLQEEALSILKELYETDSNVWAENYANSLNGLITSYFNNNQISEAISLQEKSLVILKELYETDSNGWIDYYTGNLEKLASSYLDLKKFKVSKKYFKKYFKVLSIHDISLAENLFYIIYPFVKYVQSTIHINCIETLNEANEYINDSIDYFKKKFEEEYFSQIEEYYTIYKTLKDDKDEITREKYYIFKKIFIDEENIKINDFFKSN